MHFTVGELLRVDITKAGSNYSLIIDYRQNAAFAIIYGFEIMLKL